MGGGGVGVGGGEVGVDGGKVGVAVSDAETGMGVGVRVGGPSVGVADAIWVAVGGIVVAVGWGVSVAIETAGVKLACDEASAVAW